MEEHGEIGVPANLSIRLKDFRLASRNYLGEI